MFEIMYFSSHHLQPNSNVNPEMIITISDPNVQVYKAELVVQANLFGISYENSPRPHPADV